MRREITEGRREALTGYGYVGTRPDVQSVVPFRARNVLELGCSNGSLGETIKKRQEASVVGVELEELFIPEAAERLDRVICSDAEAFVREAPPPEAPFDCLIAADVLEHLVDPWETLRRAVAMLSPGATVVVSVPNVFNWRALRKATKQQRWPRDDVGIFDSTHLRWFGPSDAHDLLAGAGLTSIEVRPVYWMTGWRLSLIRALAHTRVTGFLPAQLLATGTVPLKQSERQGDSAVTDGAAARQP